jgi:hypothetical protein
MKPMSSRLKILTISVLVVLLLLVLIATAPKNPVALIRVVDAAGQPVVGAVIVPEGLRTKPGPYVSGWYSWRTDKSGVPNPPVTTDKEGSAHVPYPKYVFERIETGTLCLEVDHPDFVPDRPERIVATAPPAGAPWRVRVDDLWNRIRHKALFVRPDPVVLQKGATVKISVQTDAAGTKDARLFCQASGVALEDPNFWIRPGPGAIMTRRLAAGPHTVRAVQLASDGSVWFSDVLPITAVTSQSNELVVTLKRGVAVRGQLDNSVPRPVKNGRVVAHVWPLACKPQDNPPQWHAWSKVHEDGSFALDWLPEGDLEIVGLCDGFVSTNGPGQFQIRYPQKHLLGTNDLAISIAMEPTARLEVHVTDDKGHPLKDARVGTWPNVRYGEWSATILTSDCYKTSDWLLSKPGKKFSWGLEVLDFQGVSDSAGLAVLPNIPADVKVLSVEHPQFALPAVGPDGDQKRRQATFILVAGQTNRISVQLEPRERSKIAHY